MTAPLKRVDTWSDIRKFVTYYLAIGLLSPKQFVRWSKPTAKICLVVGLGLLIPGMIWGLMFAPVEAAQGNVYRILYVHVPATALAQIIYFAIGVAASLYLVFRLNMAPAFITATAPIGALFAVMVVITGMLWGKDTWGVYWQWTDARLLSSAVLVFFYLILLAMQYSDIPGRHDMALSVVALLGTVNLPIVQYSVVWWQSIHQQKSFSLGSFDTSVAMVFILPLMFCLVGTMAIAASIALVSMRSQVVMRTSLSIRR